MTKYHDLKHKVIVIAGGVKKFGALMAKTFVSESVNLVLHIIKLRIQIYVGKLITIIQNIENDGLIIAERQLWVKKPENNLYEIRSKRAANMQRAIYFQVQGPVRSLKKAKNTRE